MNTQASNPTGTEPGSPGGNGADPFSEDQGAHLDDVFGFGEATAEVEAADDLDGASVGAEEGEEGAGAREGKPAPSEPTTTEPAPEPTPAPSDSDLQLTSLQKQIEELKTALAAKSEEQPKPEGEGQQQQPQPTLPDPVKITLPKEYTNALFGDDVEQAEGAMNAIVSGLMTQFNNSIHTIIQHFEGKISALEKGAVPASAPQPSSGSPLPASSANDTEELASMRSQYFSAYPAHNSPAIQPVLAAVAGEMAAQFPGHPWDQKYIASMGTRVNKRLQEMANLVAPAANRPSPSLPPSARSAAPGSSAGDISDEIMNTLDVFSS